MDFELSEKEKKWQSEVRQLVNEKIRPRAVEVDETGKYPWDNVHDMAGMGLYRLPIPQEFGGLEESYLTQCVVEEEIARGCASTGLTLCASWIIAMLINLAGNKEQKARYLPAMARGERAGTVGLTEYEAGSDAGALETLAVQKGDAFELNGVKRFAGGAGISELYIIAAKTAPEKGSKGVSLFLVESGTPGFQVSRIERKMGFRGQPHGDLVLRNCRVPSANLFGKPNEGLRLIMHSLDYGRLLGAANAVGIAQAAFDGALDYGKKRSTFGQPIVKHQAIQFMLVDMAIALDTGRLITHQAAVIKDRGPEKSFARYAAMAKLYTSEMVVSVTDSALQIFGGVGYMKDSAIERAYRDARAWKLMDGTSEIQRMTIGRELLKE